ncbi:MFS transporter [Halalkalicoccus subterraneus]|uniref:MFS transporter n=1 Tax=Halalkalicoccus subterraneus TaxID=2675002 RepID=UPI000EFA69C1|nr:MFS transporter [Halalkalicoccus subterraneus]
MTTPSSETVDLSTRAYEELGFSRWWQLVATAVMMGLVSPYKYVWTAIQEPLARDLGLSLAALGAAFTLFVVFLSISQFPAGLYRDRFGPRNLSILAGMLAGGGYVGLAYATALWHVYLFYSLGAIGVGVVYTVGTNSALKWFPDKRGFTTGVGTMMYAGGSAVFIPYVRANATVDAFPGAVQNIGILICVGVVASAVVLRDPPTGWMTDGGARSDSSTQETDHSSTETIEMVTRQYTWREMIRTRQFRILFAMFAGITSVSYMLAGNIVLFAENSGIGAGIATAAATALPIADGLGRVAIGGISDRLGRERSMLIAFSACGIGALLVVLSSVLGLSTAFLGAVVFASFFQGTQYTLVPSLMAGYFGDEHSSANYAIVYLMEIGGGVFGGIGVGWLAPTVGWSTTFVLGGVLGILAALGAVGLRSPSHG